MDVLRQRGGSSRVFRADPPRSAAWRPAAGAATDSPFAAFFVPHKLTEPDAGHSDATDAGQGSSTLGLEQVETERSLRSLLNVGGCAATPSLR